MQIPALSWNVLEVFYKKELELFFAEFFWLLIGLER